MTAYAKKIAKVGTRPVARHFYEKQDCYAFASQIVDNRPDTVTQKKLQEMANNSPRNREISKLQAMANNSSVIQKVKTLSEIAASEARIKPQQAFIKYLEYLTFLARVYDSDAGYMIPLFADIGRRINAEEEMTVQIIKNYKAEIKIYTDQLQEIESAIAKPVDSDVKLVYQPLKACVIQSLEQNGALGMTALAYHKKLWKEDDPLKYYDMDEIISPMYSRFGFTEIAYGGKYQDLVSELPVGHYIVNVTSPAGPNGHMFALEIKAGTKKKNKPDLPIPRQDGQNTQAWADGDKVLRYWKK